MRRERNEREQQKRRNEVRYCRGNVYVGESSRLSNKLRNAGKKI